MAKENKVTKKEQDISQSSEEQTLITVPSSSTDTIAPEAEPTPTVATATQDAEQAAPRGGLMKSASLVGLGNLVSSLVGMVRQSTVASLGPVLAAAFSAALSPAQRFIDLLVTGAVTGALVPTFNDYAADEKRTEMRRIVYTVVNLILLITIISTVAFYFLAPVFFDSFLVSGFDATNKPLTLQFGRIIFCSLLFLGPYYVLSAALYALKEFGFPPLAQASYHIGIMIGVAGTTLLGAHFIGLYALPLGTILGTMGEVAILIPALRRHRLGYMFVLDLSHPAIRRILKLYAPIAVSFIVSIAVTFLDTHLASDAPCAAVLNNTSACGEANISAMTFATTLIQFPQGLVGTALGAAVLPFLNEFAREGNLERFKEMLRLGFRLGLLLMVPAMAGLLLLQYPIMSALFEHGGFKAEDALNGALALQYYSFQLPFIAIDQLAISAFYARKNTVIPVIVSFISVLGYLLIALPFSHTWGMPALAFANSVQNSLHAIILLIWLRLAIGELHLRTMIPSVLKILVATLIMAAAVWGLLQGISIVPLPVNKFIGNVIKLAVCGGLGAALYFVVASLLKVEEISMVKGVLLAKLGKKKA
ncbi:putative peptidoglycan lipid II flippase [Thermosporothrix hazakensis]|jgi:putative peptidoglycan lipid II flippase|uniref:Putative peptidoglycan lipid II flippase n=1 Tax=Thermosporothrix hazakensis TaxID=644383 RepID=A0A326TVU8_THEHA|nr:lipid II flippase MurJ [Thermosporothrix hazakensis]PZW19725.1 putative peptidoglycan lipid II flippase [Thermosporothrix hazakensis]GCE48593.1 putative lipid II flippase MurJ [Thermosporothrix hazakensis]